MSCESESKRFVFNWKIENFHYCALQKMLISPFFVPHTLDKALWSVYMTSSPSQSNAYFYFVRVIKSAILSNLARNITFKFEIHISSDDDSKLKVLKQASKVVSIDPNQTHFKFPQPVDMYEILRGKGLLFLPGNAITLPCYMWSEEVLKEGHCSARTVLGVGKYSDQIILYSLRTLNSNRKIKRVVNGIKVCLTVHDNFQVDLYFTHNRWSKCVTCELCVIDCEMKKAFAIRDAHCFEKENKNQEWNIPWTLSKRKLLENKDRYLHNGDLIIQVCLVFSTGQKCQKIDFDSQSDHHVTTTGPEVTSALSNDLLSLYNEKNMCDFNLVAATGETFPVHKVILSSRSPVFRAMIDNDMKEKSTKSADIPDSDGNTLNRLILFAYTDKVEDLDYESASKLYFAADKYQMLSLKQRCSAFMKSILSVKNVCDVLALADLHQDADLKRVARDFVFFKDYELIQSDEWKKLLASNPSLAAETLQLLFMHKLEVQ